MIYEVRTYTLRPGGAVAEFEERFAKRLPLREQHSKLGAFWHTEFGPLNQVIHVYPYDDLHQRTAVRAALAQDTARQQLPGGGICRGAGVRDYQSGAVYASPEQPGLRHRERLRDADLHLCPGGHPQGAGWVEQSHGGARGVLAPGGLLDQRDRRAEQVRPHLGVQGSQRAHTRP